MRGRIVTLDMDMLLIVKELAVPETEKEISSVPCCLPWTMKKDDGSCPATKETEGVMNSVIPFCDTGVTVKLRALSLVSSRRLALRRISRRKRFAVSS